jgi:hypothetical protein
MKNAHINSLAVLLSLVLSSAAAGQAPQGCYTYSTETDYCSDFEGGCSGSLPNVIQYLEDDGTQGLIYQTLACSTSPPCTGKPGTCYQCQSYPGIPVAWRTTPATEAAGAEGATAVAVAPATHAPAATKSSLPVPRRGPPFS